MRSDWLMMTFCLLLGLVLTGGCAPAVDEEEMGTLLDRPPKLPGMEEPYKVPGVIGPIDEQDDVDIEDEAGSPDEPKQDVDAAEPGEDEQPMNDGS